jgi:S1-C subfamily serine protease
MRLRYLLGLITGIILVIAAFFIYWHITRIQEHEATLEQIKKELLTVQQVQQLPCRPLGNDLKNWGTVQTELKDSVVQVFSEIAEFNWLEPYKSPTQLQSSGSGFFINDTGEIITNAHVVDQAKALTIQIPSFGKRRFDITLLGVSPERDLALVQLQPEDLAEIKATLKRVPFVTLGNSDQVHRSDQIMALGYPLGQQSLKSTTGVVSGRETLAGQQMIQISAPINPGNSGGPSLNCYGQVIGVNTANIPSAQNVGYIIPSNEVALFIKQIKQMPTQSSCKFLRKPYLGVLYNAASETLTDFLGNPQPGGMYVAGTVTGSTLEKAGVKAGDMIYEIDGHRIDVFGEMNVPWSEDKISVTDYVSRLMINDKVNLKVYRKGKPLTLKVTFKECELAPVRVKFPAYEKIDYEIFGGLIFMELALNHLPLLVSAAPELTKYVQTTHQQEGTIIITHMFPASGASRSRTVAPGRIIKEVNGEKVKDLSEFREALKKSLTTKFVTLKTPDDVLIVMPLDDILLDEQKLSRDYFYTITPFTKEFIKQAEMKGILKTHENQKTA